LEGSFTDKVDALVRCVGNSRLFAHIQQIFGDFGLQLLESIQVELDFQIKVVHNAAFSTDGHFVYLFLVFFECFEAVFEFKVFFKMGSTLGFVGIGTQFFGQPLNDLMVPLHSCQQLVVFRCTAFGDLAHGDVFWNRRLLVLIKLRNNRDSWIGINVHLMV